LKSMEDLVERQDDVKFPAQPKRDLTVHQFQSTYASSPPCSDGNRKGLRILGRAPEIRPSPEIVRPDDLPGGSRIRLPDKKFIMVIIEDDW